MKASVLFSAVAALLTMTACSGKKEADEQKISIFFEHIEAIAQQEGISFREAAQAVHALGYRGVDLSSAADPAMMDLLDSLGFEHSCLITYLDYRPENLAQTQEAEDRTLSVMREREYERVLLVPLPLAPETAPEIIEGIISHLADFSVRLKEAGFEAFLEDFDNPRSLCYNTASLDRLFAACPDLGLAFDSGNFFFCGEDEIEALDHFLPRIGHVHLKDRRSAEDLSCPAVGSGAVQIEAIVRKLIASGYDGWYTMEFFGSKQMLEDAKQSIAFFREIENSIEN